MRVDEVRIDPARLRAGQLRNIQLAWRKQHLPRLAIDHVPIDVRRRMENIIRPKRLHLRDGVVERTPIPQADIVEEHLVLARVDGRVGVGVHFHFANLAGKPVCRARRFDVGFDVNAFEGDFVRFHVE